MPRKYCIGIDFGTESARVLIVDVSNGRHVSTVVHTYRNGAISQKLPGTRLRLEDDTWLQNPRDYIDVLRKAIPTALRKGRINPKDVIGLGVDFTSCTMMPIDEKGNPLCFDIRFRSNPHAWVKLWKHHAAQPEADRINEVAQLRNESLLRRYGGKISSEWFLPKVFQILNDAPEVYDAAAKFIEAGDWIVMKLVGEEKRSACQAGYKCMWSREEGFPSREFLKAVDPKLEIVVQEKMSTEIYPIGTKAGNLTKEMAVLTSLTTDCTVAVAIIDAHSAVPAATVTEPGKMVIIMGTSGCHMICGPNKYEIEGISGYVYEGILPKLYGYEAGQASMGDVFDWYMKFLSSGKKRVNSFAVLEPEAKKLKPGQAGLLALDWLNGCRTPLVDADLSGAVMGITLSTTPAEIYRSFIEATAYGTNLIIETFETQGLKVNELYACGGLAEKNKLLLHVLSDVTGREIRIAKSPYTSALGAAMWGAVATGASGGGYNSIEEAAKKMASIKKEVYKPTPENHEIYKELYHEYRTFVEYFGKKNEVMKRLKALRKAEVKV